MPITSTSAGVFSEYKDDKEKEGWAVESPLERCMAQAVSFAVSGAMMFGAVSGDAEIFVRCVIAGQLLAFAAVTAYAWRKGMLKLS